MAAVQLLEGDNRDHLRRMIDDGVRVHSVVTDPPYGLTSVVKRFGKASAAPAKHQGNDGAFTRTGAGFMGQQWDGSGIERDPEFWRLVHDILLPGGFCLAFSGARTGHWQAVAMEQAGFIMHPLTGWVFGSGFPKALDAGRAIEALLSTGGTGPKNIRMLDMGDEYRQHALAGTENYGVGRMSRGADTDRDYNNKPDLEREDARAWEGWKLGAAALKPALEPIYFAQRPFSEKTGAKNVLKHGVGALNIDGCRVPTEDNLDGGRVSTRTDGWDRPWKHDDEAIARCKEPGAAAVAKAQELGRYPANLLHDGSGEMDSIFPDGTARFFNGFPVEPEAVYYHSKASTKDRVFQCSICGEHGVGIKPQCECRDNQGNRKLRGHPTVKPIGLMRHLVRLVTPSGGTVLDPFAGTGTTAAAAVAEGFDCILIEGQADYAEDIRARLEILPRKGTLSYNLDDLL